MSNFIDRRKLAGALAVSLAMPGLIVSVSVLPAASASSQDASITSTATMEEECRWVLLGAPTGLTLAANGEYVGTSLEMSASVDTVSAHSTGNDDDSVSFDSFTDCTFFGSVTRPTITMSLDDSSFSASYVNDSSETVTDAGMGFDLDTSNFSLNLTGTCDAKWTTDTAIDFTNSSLSSILMEIGTISDVTARAENGVTENDVCGLGGTASVDIPAGRTPDGPGKPYTFSGPALTTALTTSSTDK